MRNINNPIQEKRGISPGPILFFSLLAVLLIGGFTYYFFYLKPLDNQGFSCVSNAECDDGNACTIDQCSPRTGICYHPKKDCARGEFCNNVGECELVVKPEEPQTEQTTIVQNQTENITEEQTPTPTEISTMDQIENAINEALGL